MPDAPLKTYPDPESSIGPVLDARFFETFANVNNVEKRQREKFRAALVIGAILLLLNYWGVLKLTGPKTVYFATVILIHEFGHFVGMRLCGYRGVGLLFLPYLSDSAQGVRTHASPLREAIVILLGPLPGMFIGLILSFLAVLEFSDSIRFAAMCFLAFNSISLLPCLPFDGGRLLQRVVLVRSRYLMAIVQLTLASFLVLVGWLLGMKYTVILGLGSLFWTTLNFRFDSIAQRLHDQFPDLELGESGQVSMASAANIVKELRRHVPFTLRFGMDAWAVRSVWERLMAKPAGLGTILMSLAAYATAFVLFVCTTVGLMLYPEEQLSTIQLPDGTEQKQATIFLLGDRVIEVTVSDEGRYHGEQKTYVPGGDAVLVEGEWKNGYMEGVWTTSTEDGNAISRMTLKQGELIKFEEFRDGAWVESTPANIAWFVRYDLWRHRRVAPEGPHQSD